MNSFKVVFLLGLLTGLFLIVGGVLGGQSGMIIAFAFAVIMNFGAYWFSDKIVLGIYRAKEVSRDEAPGLHRAVEKVAVAAQVPKPKVYILPMPVPNAFATGRDPAHAAVAVTKGLMEMLTPEELEGVIAHEMAHVKNRDTLIQCLAATIAGAIMMLASMARWAAIFGGYGRDERDRSGMFTFIIMAVLAPIAAMLIQMAISRSREYLADASGAKYLHNPSGLANALRKLDHVARRYPLETSPATSHLFIVNPLSARGIASLFSTHPPAEERIKRLEKMIA
ncbi:MAG: zinc metalloprotease HtpX [bacterium]